MRIERCHAHDDAPMFTLPHGSRARGAPGGQEGPEAGDAEGAATEPGRRSADHQARRPAATPIRPLPPPPATGSGQTATPLKNQL
jgi:hypothetical protein